MRQTGITLLELLITLTIIALLTALIVPGYKQFIASHTATIASNRLVGTLHFARIQSVSRGKVITLCPRGENNRCGEHWHKGIWVFEDLNSDGVFDVESEETLLLVTPPFRKGSKITWSSFKSKKYLRFTPEGLTLHQNGSFTYCPADKDPRYARQIVLNKAGRARRAPDNNNNGIVENTQGKDLSCW